MAHIGKFVKVASGIMNTHSHSADARMETLCANAVRAGGGLTCAKEILNCNTTDEALAVLKKTRDPGRNYEHLMERIQFYLDQ